VPIVLRGWLGTGGISNERFSVTFQHHKTTKTLRDSNEVVGCSICRALTHELEKCEELDVTEDTEIAIQAELTRLEDQDNLAFRKGSEDRAIFRLDFILEKEQLGPRMEMEKAEILLRTFALKPTSKSPIVVLFSVFVSSAALLLTLSPFLCIQGARDSGLNVDSFASFEVSFSVRVPFL
jgi:hypothetical protein